MLVYGTGAIALMTVAIGLAGCHGGGAAASAPAPEKAASVTPTQVSVVAARIGAIEQAAQVTGTLTAQDDVVVGAKAAGRLAVVFKREGDSVRANEVVAQMDTADLQNQLDQQVSNLAAARTRLDSAKVAYADAQTNLALTDAQTASAVRQAQAAYSAAKEQLAEVKAGARTQERQQAQETVAAAKADRDIARSDLKRYRDLFDQKAVSAQQVDQAQAAADSADARYNSAVQALSLVQEGSRVEDIRRSQFAADEANQALVTAQANRSQLTLRRSDVDTARQNIAVAKSTVDQAAASVRLAQQALADASIRSPIDGVIQERRAEAGQQLGAGKDVMRIVSLQNVYFDAQLPEAQFARVTAGQHVDVTVDGQPGHHFDGVVYRLFPVASAGARSFTVRIRLLNGGTLVRPSMFARGQIVLATHPHAVLVPRDAILDATDQDGRLFIVQDKIAHEVKVKLGFANPKEVEIIAGVHGGDQVVDVGQAQLQDGTPVQIISGGKG
jgi:RND family efflux transporter MFP subunit